MKILITGASGMVGSNLVECHSPQNLLTPSREELNLLDYQMVEEYLLTHKPDMVIHCAGIVGGISANMRDPVKFYLDNLDMGRNIVGAAHTTGIEKLINIGSSCMYPKSDSPLTEDMILKGELEKTNEGYALAKIFTLKLCEYYGYKTIIPCNLYGRYDKFGSENSHMVAAIIVKIVRGNVDIWGDGTARRESMYAGDFAGILWRLVRGYDELPLIMNIGTGYDYSVNEYYNIIADVIGFKGEFRYDTYKPVGVRRKLLDISLQKRMSLMPDHNLQEGVKKTYEYYLSTCK